MENLTPMQIAVYAVNSSNTDEYIIEIMKMIEQYGNSEYDNGFSIGYDQALKNLKEQP